MPNKFKKHNTALGCDKSLTFNLKICYNIKMIDAQKPLLTPAEDFDAVAVLNFPHGDLEIPQEPGKFADPRLDNPWGRANLIAALQDQGIEPFVTRGVTYYDLESGSVRVLSPDVTQQPARVEHRGWYDLSSIDVVHNVAKVLAIDEAVPQLNNAAVRNLARDRYKTATLLQRAGLHEGSVLVTSEGLGHIDMLDEQPGTMVFLKQRYGSGPDTEVGRMTKAQASEFLQTADLEQDYVVEAALDYSHRWPAEIRGLDEVNQVKLDAANDENKDKHLRAIAFGDGQYYFQARVDYGWVYLDQESIPGSTRAVAKEVYARFAEETGVNEMHIAIDMAQASSAATDGHTLWRVGNVVGSEPRLAEYNDNAEVAAEHRKHLAVQIARIARKRTLA